MKEPKKKCPMCYKMKPENEISVHVCGYAQDVAGSEVWEECCEDCEAQHVADI